MILYPFEFWEAIRESGLRFERKYLIKRENSWTTIPCHAVGACARGNNNQLLPRRQIAVTKGVCKVQSSVHPLCKFCPSQLKTRGISIT